MQNIWTLISAKGGCGKSTMAIVLASELTRVDQKVTLIDCDPSQNLNFWKDNGRDASGKSRLPSSVKIISDLDKTGKSLKRIILEEENNSDIIIIDTEGSNNKQATIATANSSLTIVPVTTGMWDAREATKAVELIKSIARQTNKSIRCVVVRSRAPTALLSKSEKGVRNFLKKKNIVVSEYPLFERAVFQLCVEAGCLLQDISKYDKIAGLDKAQINAGNFINALVVAAQSDDAIQTPEKEKP